MKYIIIALLLISCGKEKEKISKQEPSIWLEESLKESLVDFVAEAEVRGIHDVIDRVLSLDTIMTVPNDGKYLGLSINNNIYINEDLLSDPAATKAIMYHELFHSLFELKHCHDKGFDIMCKSYPKNWDYSIYENEVFWQASIDREFDKIVK